MEFAKRNYESEPLEKATALGVKRRDFLREAAGVAAIGCLSPGLLLGCQAESKHAKAASANADSIDEALGMMSSLGPLGNHGPMAAEALVALDRADAVIPFVETYKKRFTMSYPPERLPVTRENWQQALSDGARTADWIKFFTRELAEAAWPDVLERWSARLAPGLSAAAGHGFIRTGHAARSLTRKDTVARKQELAEGLAYWASYYQPLPESAISTSEKLRPIEAIKLIPILPEERRARGSIMAGVRSLSDYAPFAKVGNLVAPVGKAEQFLSELTETFATVYVERASQRSFITLLHSITGLTSIRSLLPYLSPATTEKLLHHGWLMGAALYSIAGATTTNTAAVVGAINRTQLIDQAVASKEEHAIKFTEACLREYDLNPKPVYLQAARDRLQRL